MKVSLILTVKNEEATIGAFLDSVAAQTRQPDEIVIVDGGSTDRTRELVSSHPLEARLEVFEGNIASGRNKAIELATGELIAVTDAGCVLDHDWLERVTDLQGADVVVGGYAPVIASLFDACQYSIHNIFRPKDKLEGYAISSRSLAFLKVVWEELGGYPEWLEHSEDTWFHNMIRQSRFTMRLEPRAVVHWRMRPDAKAVFRQFYRYMQGDGRALQHTKRHLIRLGAYAAGLEMLLMGMWRPGWFIPLILGFGLYVYQPVRNFRALNAYPLTAKAVAMIAGLLLVADAGKIAGYLSGLKNAHELPPSKPRRQP